jgi:hypothetical protein
MQHRIEIKDRLRLFKLIVAVLLLMMLGTAVELYLLGHYEDTKQLFPIICILLLFIGLFSLWLKPVSIIRWLCYAIVLVTGLSGFYGSYLHLKANYEFELEMTPTADFWNLLTESLSGALPVLAPASMLVLAIIAYTFLTLLKHPK